MLEFQLQNSWRHNVSRWPFGLGTVGNSNKYSFDFSITTQRKCTKQSLGLSPSRQKASVIANDTNNLFVQSERGTVYCLSLHSTALLDFVYIKYAAALYKIVLLKNFCMSDVTTKGSYLHGGRFSKGKKEINQYFALWPKTHVQK